MKVGIIMGNSKFQEFAEFKKWMGTQRKTNGDHYSCNTIDNYLSALRKAPQCLSSGDSDLEQCVSPDEFERLYKEIRLSSDFDSVNEQTKGAFSAALAKYERYINERYYEHGENNHSRTSVKTNSIIVTRESNMTLPELSTKLGEMYHNAPEGDKVAMIHLFGIRYAKEIINLPNEGDVRKQIAIESGTGESYHVEISKGIRLSKYVIDKESLKTAIAKLVD